MSEPDQVTPLPDGKVEIQLDIDPETMELLEAAAKKQGVSVEQFVEQALMEMFDNRHEGSPDGQVGT